LRGPIYAALFVLIPNAVLQGFFAWGLVALFVFDVIISIWDFSLEQGSRRFLGGLPSGEYVLHMIMAMVFGGLVISTWHGASAWLNSPTRIAYAPTGVPVMLRVIMVIMAVLVMFSGLQDALAAWRLWSHPLRCDIQPPGSSDPVIQLSNIGGKRLVTSPTDAGERAKRGPGWMRVILIAAGVYNLAWGAWVVLFPAALFRWTGLATANYPQIWQCVGMIVGVYGVGYLIAAHAPIVHWPIVLVGLLGKILGPLGMFCSVAKGDFPASMAWTCVTNDLIWWVPFALILYHAYAARRLGLFEKRYGLPQNIGS
jgi:hypothetical protein